jgi:hypothetical protein
MDFTKFLGRLDEMGGADEGSSGSNAFSAVQSKTGAWGYIPEKSYLGGLLKPVVIENGDKWSILYCSPGGKGAKTSRASLDDSMQGYGRAGKTLNEAISDWGGASADTLKDWTIMDEWTGSFEECLKKCVAIVTNKPGEDPNISKFQAFARK